MRFVDSRCALWFIQCIETVQYYQASLSKELAANILTDWHLFC